MLSPIKVEEFGGLNLTDDSGTVGWTGALDILNVDLSRPGRVLSRPGYGPGITTTAAPQELYYSSVFNQYLVTETGNNLRAYNASTGVTVATQANVSDSDSVDYFTPTASRVYTVTLATAGLVTWDGSAFTNDGALTALSVAVTPWDNRLVRAGTASNPNRVMFSDAGDPATYGANNYVDLAPGRGNITAVRTWGNLLVVFKPDRFFVFYGVSTDSTGNPIFNYRSVETGGVGLGVPNVAVAGTEGIYFLGADGIYVTDGGAPRKVSSRLDPWFRGETIPFFTVWATPTGAVDMTYSDGRLFMSVQGQYVLVLLPSTGQWSIYDFPAYGLASTAGHVMFSDSGHNKILDHGFDPASYTTDNGAAITSRYRSGFSDLGSPDMKRIHSWRLQGTGSPTLKLSSDFGSLETGAAVTLGTSPAIAEGVRRYAPRGRQFSFQLSGTSAWSVNSVVAQVAGKRRTGEHVSA